MGQDLRLLAGRTPLYVLLNPFGHLRPVVVGP
jgi:hypothetical protein